MSEKYSDVSLKINIEMSNQLREAICNQVGDEVLFVKWAVASEINTQVKNCVSDHVRLQLVENKYNNNARRKEYENQVR